MNAIQLRQLRIAKLKEIYQQNKTKNPVYIGSLINNYLISEGLTEQTRQSYYEIIKHYMWQEEHK